MAVEVDVSGLPLKEGDMLPVVVTARGSDAETTVTSTYAVMSLPSRPGWYPGDGHIHSAWSPDVVYTTIDDRAASAVSNGLKWIVITDHQNGITDRWLNYVAECNMAQVRKPIPVMPGLEVTAVEADGKADALGYRLSETNSSLPPNQTLSPQNLTNAYNNHNPGLSYPNHSSSVREP